MQWYDLPRDILLPILDQLDVDDLSNLEHTSGRGRQVVADLGWPNLLSRSRMHHLTLASSQCTWSIPSIVRYNHRIVRNIAETRFLAKQLGPTWERGARPVVHLDQERLLVATGHKLRRYEFSDVAGGGAAAAKWVGRFREATVPLVSSKKQTLPTAMDDITGLVKLSNGQLVVSTVGGALQRITTDGKSTARYPHPNTAVESLSSHGNRVLAASHDGLLTLFDAASPWVPSTTTRMDARPWSTLLKDSWAAVGCSGTEALRLYAITPTGLVADGCLAGGARRSSAVYDLATPHDDMSTPFRSCLLSAWFDGSARMHDLRTRRLVMELSDRWTDAALYSCDFFALGHVVAGSARHGMLSVWDPRMGGRGWSAYAPGGDESPVYKVKGEGGRVWGVTSHRAFGFGFDGSSELGTWSGEGEEAVSGRMARWTPGMAGAGKKSARSYATGYRHEDQTLRLFTSVNA